jgi:hypothetical protein
MPATAASKVRGARQSPIGLTSNGDLCRPGVTLMLLWEEYRQHEPGGYRYSRRGQLYRVWECRLSTDAPSPSPLQTDVR